MFVVRRFAVTMHGHSSFLTADLQFINAADDSVEMAVNLFQEVGQYLQENSPAIAQE